MNETLRQSLIVSISSALVTRFGHAAAIAQTTYAIVNEIELKEAERSQRRDYELVVNAITLLELHKPNDKGACLMVLTGFAQECCKEASSILFPLGFRLAENLKRLSPSSIDDDDINKALQYLERMKDSFNKKPQAVS